MPTKAELIAHAAGNYHPDASSSSHGNAQPEQPTSSGPEPEGESDTMIVPEVSRRVQVISTMMEAEMTKRLSDDRERAARQRESERQQHDVETTALRQSVEELQQRLEQMLLLSVIPMAGCCLMNYQM